MSNKSSIDYFWILRNNESLTYYYWRKVVEYFGEDLMYLEVKGDNYHAGEIRVFIASLIVIALEPILIMFSLRKKTVSEEQEK